MVTLSVSYLSAEELILTSLGLPQEAKVLHNYAYLV